MCTALQKWDSLCKTQDLKTIYLISGIVVILSLVLLYAVCGIKFMENDDCGMMATLAGMGTGEPSPYATFENVIYGYLISGLYRITQSIPWYTVVFVALMAVSLTVMCADTILILKDVRYGILVFEAAFLLVFAFPLAELQFTMVPGVIGGAAVCQLLSGFCYRGKTYIGNRASVVFLFLFSWWIRKETGYIVLSVLLLYLGIELVVQLFPGLEGGCKRKKAGPVRGKAENDNKSGIQESNTAASKTNNTQGDDNGNETNLHKSRIIEILVMGVLLILLGVGSSKVHNGYAERQGYLDNAPWDRARASYMDYGRIGYKGSEAAIDGIGWDENLLNLVNQWFFMDERVTEDAFSELAEYRDTLLPKNEGKLGQIFSMWSDGSERVGNVQLLVLLFSIGATLILWAVKGASVKTEPVRQSFFLPFVILAGTALMLLEIIYLLVQGRFLLRVYEAVLLVFFYPLVLLMLMLWKDGSWFRDQRKTDGTRPGAVFLLGMYAVILITNLAGAGAISAVYTDGRSEGYRSGVARQYALLTYAGKHSENIYISL